MWEHRRSFLKGEHAIRARSFCSVNSLEFSSLKTRVDRHSRSPGRLLDPPSATGQPPATPQTDDDSPGLAHPLMRLCKYASETEGVYGSNVLCEAHNDVGFITLDPRASTAGLEALRRAGKSSTVPLPHITSETIVSIGSTVLSHINLAHESPWLSPSQMVYGFQLSTLHLQMANMCSW